WRSFETTRNNEGRSKNAELGIPDFSPRIRRPCDQPAPYRDGEVLPRSLPSSLGPFQILRDSLCFLRCLRVLNRFFCKGLGFAGLGDRRHGGTKECVYRIMPLKAVDVGGQPK